MYVSGVNVGRRVSFLASVGTEGNSPVGSKRTGMTRDRAGAGNDSLQFAVVGSNGEAGLISDAAPTEVIGILTAVKHTFRLLISDDASWPLNSPAAFRIIHSERRLFKKAVYRISAPTFMSSPTTPNGETSPLLGNQRTESYQTLVSNENTPRTDDKEASGVSLVWVLAALWSAVFLGALDGTIVATLLSPIGAHFNRSNQSSYIGTAYLLSVCCFTPLYGRLSDILGRKGAMLLGLSLFGSGTLLCGIAPSMNVLIAARALAGMGGGGSVLQYRIIRCRSQCLRLHFAES